mmetsp:Transcript_1198/g.2876  ORF Transcript_1198/g.2876 Transcript_1198/m.2876 type:complete len:265 (+) Transcript_1198:1239-2033(+)
MPRTSKSMIGASIFLSWLSVGSSRKKAIDCCWSFSFMRTYVSPAFSPTTWFTTMRLQGMLSLRSDCNSRALSSTAMYVGMVAMTNSVISLFRKSDLTTRMRCCKTSSLATVSSCFSDVPNKERTTAVAPASFLRSLMILPNDDSTKSGRLSSLSVWPVGAVSNTMREKRAYSADSANWTTFAVATASSRPGGGVSSSSPSFRSASWLATMPMPMPLIKSCTCSPVFDSWLYVLNSLVASSGSTSSPHKGRSVPSRGTGLPPLTS